ncbi:MAG: SynChlorMet cassette protein ScmD [Candidatus Sabulitectum sp.]|nr:SynChlorMet cassette protein ScmD [Candidatus Sabulitectum sp.]
MDKTKRLQTNSDFVFRKEYDDWAILFNPNTSDTYGLNPIGIFIYKLLDTNHSVGEIVNLLQSNCKNVPPDAEGIVDTFLEDLVAKGIAQYRGQVLS